MLESQVQGISESERGGWTDRYSRQVRFAPIGDEGQRRLREASVMIAGCGALGASLAQHMARSGVGKLVIVDRDYVEPSNLQRQTLFDEEDARRALPKAEAAAGKLRRINGEVTVEAHVADMREGNVRGFSKGVDLILDGTDNVATRLMLSDEAFRLGIPFLYGGATASQGMSAMLIPGRTVCLRCLIGGEEEAEEGETCDSMGVLSATVEFVAALQAVEAIKWLTGNRDAIRGTWVRTDIWNFGFRESKMPSYFPGCPHCGGGTEREAFEVEASPLAGRPAALPAVLCGRDTVQVTMEGPLRLDSIAEKLQALGCRLTVNRYLVKAELPRPRAVRLVLFPDGRVLVQGTTDIAKAETLCNAYVSQMYHGQEETIR
ncbi:ThiF family adenylyltransferase [Paenibacillus sp. LHD-117]|uniref:ThiF family adenylyltransferase n=1 Tax=Paenibacillus sp. LHD-117 TaxID=3071412 RepID=UPI0027E1FF3B|nr:ThiF family adenylyltransferase [Paenibacillus sp. LHD-117]MDQ6418325.1 ThiF family adenylyltransferase [Paenibacillus sp. LHD-117]